MPDAEKGSIEVPMKATRTKKPAATAESKNLPTDRGPAVIHEKGGERPRARRRFTIIDDDWARNERQRGRLKEALLTDWWILEAKERTRKIPDTIVESRYEPTDYERGVLAKQAERLKDRVRAPRMKFVEDERGGRLAFDHPDQVIAFALLKEAFGTADDQFANGLLHYLCAELPIDENSAFEFPRTDDLNRAISLIAARRVVDEIEAEIVADWAVCRIIIERLLHDVREPLKYDLSPELKLQLLHYQRNPKGEVKIDSGPVREFSLRYATKLMKVCIELLAAADRHRAIVEPSRKMQQLSAARTMKARLGEIRHATPNATSKKATVARAARLNGSAVPELRQKTDSTRAPKGNGHIST